MITIELNEIECMFKKLSEIHRAALPNAVRNTLNDLAFDVKKNTLFPAWNSKFTVRNSQFVKKYSGVQKATGYDIVKMFSEVGMIPQGNASKAINNLKQQDEGGQISDRNYIPDDNARTGGSRTKKVKQRNWQSQIKLHGHVAFGDTQGLIRAVTRSRIEKGGSGQGNAVIYGNILYEIKGFKRFRKKDTIKLYLTKLYTYKKDRAITVKPHRFMSAAALESGKKMGLFFEINAQKQLAKFK